MPKIRPVYDLDAMRAARDDWYKQAEETWQKNIATTTSRLAASGMRPGTPAWQAQLGEVEAAYRDKLTEIDETETVRIIKNEEAYFERREARLEERRNQEIISGEQAFSEGDPGSREPDYLMDFSTGTVKHKSLFTLGQLDSRVRRADLDKAAGVTQSMDKDTTYTAADIEDIRGLTDQQYLERFGIGYNR